MSDEVLSYRDRNGESRRVGYRRAGQGPAVVLIHADADLVYEDGVRGAIGNLADGATPVNRQWAAGSVGAL